MRVLISLVLFLPLALAAQSFQSEGQAVRVVKLAEGLDHPWSLAFLPDGRMLVTERPGRLNLIGGDFQRVQIEGVPRVFASGQGGLLEVALHPRFAENHFVYSPTPVRARAARAPSSRARSSRATAWSICACCSSRSRRLPAGCTSATASSSTAPDFFT